MTKEENDAILQGFIAEVKALGGFEGINPLKLEQINDRFVNHLYDYEESRGIAPNENIIFKTEERTRDISIANSPSKTKKEKELYAGYYHRASSGLIRDIETWLN